MSLSHYITHPVLILLLAPGIMPRACILSCNAVVDDVSVGDVFAGDVSVGDVSDLYAIVVVYYTACL